LIDEYCSQLHKYGGEDSPEWVFLTYDEEMEWDKFDYFPREHYRMAIREYEEHVDGSIEERIPELLAESLENQMEEHGGERFR
jgi:hypothetical protein